MDMRALRICLIAIPLGLAAGVIAKILSWLIAFVTNLAFYGNISIEDLAPSGAVPSLGLWVIVIPVIGGVLIGIMARYGSRAIRGHGIPEAMEQVLTNKSQIPARITILKPVSSAVAIGTGGPFGAEGPIIATGGALGSLIGQVTASSPAERRTLLGAGAAAGMAAIFGGPVSAVLLAVELLLFEYSARSIIPVALAASAAAGVHILFDGSDPAFTMSEVAPVPLSALAFYVVLGALMGLLAVVITRSVYKIEDSFEKLPIHWMWWPAIGAAVVGVIGFFAPDTLGVGYYNISNILSSNLTLGAIGILCVMKFISWSVALGSGTSGGTLAPLFTIGGGVGALIGSLAIFVAPAAGIDARVAALVGMAALFAGASRALLASVVFAFETTLQPMALLPLLGGCSSAYFLSSMLMRNTMMTEKIARRGVQAPSEYTSDPLESVLVRDVATEQVVTLRSTQSIGEVQDWIHAKVVGSTHQGYPVVNDVGTLVGVITQREILAATVRSSKIGDHLQTLPRYVYDDCTVRQAADHMVNHEIGRLPVVNREGKPRIVGILTRSDILSAYRMRISEYKTEDATRKIFPAFAKKDQS